MESITLQTNDAIITSGDSIGQLQFAASAESDGGASRYVVGRIYGQGEGAFSASSNPASIVFATSSADNLPASGKIKISHEGHVLPLEDNVYDLGSSSQRFRHLYVADTVVSPTGELSYLYFDTTITDADQIEGQLNWNDALGTLDLGLTDDLTTHLGQDVFYRVINLSGGTIYKGQPVYAAGVNAGGQRIEIGKYIADLSVEEVRYIGLLAETLNQGDLGYVVHFGHVRKVDLRSSNTALNPNGETWAGGDVLFPDPSTAGGLTKVPPKHLIYTAIVLADGNNGELLVRITNPGEINELHNVNTSGVVDNNFLVWNSGNEEWEPSTTLTFDGTTLHTDTDGISAIFGRNNSLTNGGKVRILVDDNDTASSVQAIKAFNNKTTGTNFGINATANGLGATKNVGLYGWADQATTNWGLWVNRGYSILEDRVGIKTTVPTYDLHVNGSGNITGDMIVGGNLTIQGNTVTANVSTMEIEDPIFTLGLASGTIVTDTNLDRGLALALNNDVMAFMGWDVSESEFSLLSSGVASNGSGNYAPGTYGDLHIGALTATAANFSSTIDAANLGAGEDNSVVILDSDGKLRTDEIDSRVWGSSLVDGAGTTNYVSKWSDSNTLANSLIYDNGTDIGIGITSPSGKLHIYDNNSAGFNDTSFRIQNPASTSNTYFDIAIGTSTGYNDNVWFKRNGVNVAGIYSNNNWYHYESVMIRTDKQIRAESNGNAYIELLDGTNDTKIGYLSDLRFYSSGAEKMVLDVNGNLGIGTASPSYKLDVVGSGNFTGDVSIDGHLSASTKSFLINHPTRPGHKLQYGSLESPYHGIRLTGKGTIQSGWCVIKLPEYICNLVRDDESVNIQITNYKHPQILYVSDIDIANNEFTIKTNSWFTRNNLEFFWTFTAVRKDVEPLKVEF